MSKSLKTKAQLADENEKLKDALRDMTEGIKALKENKKGEMPLSISIPFLDEESNTFKQITLNFNPITGQAKGDIESVRQLNNVPTSAALAMQSGKECIVKYVNVLIDRFLENRNK